MTKIVARFHGGKEENKDDLMEIIIHKGSQSEILDLEEHSYEEITTRIKEELRSGEVTLVHALHAGTEEVGKLFGLPKEVRPLRAQMAERAENYLLDQLNRTMGVKVGAER